MVNECKKIVLLIGLEAMNDYHFRVIKSLLAEELSLTRKMQDDYDRIRIADLMEEKFQNDAGLSNLIALCKDIPALGELAETLDKHEQRVKGKSKEGKKSTTKKAKQNELTPAHSTTMTNTDLESESNKETPLQKKNKTEESEDPERMQLPQEQSQPLEPSATTKQQMEGCVQAPPRPPPPPSSSFPIKRPRLTSPSFVNKQEKYCPVLQRGQEMEDIVTKTHDNMKRQDSQEQHQLPELPENGMQTVSIFHTTQMPPTAPSGRTNTSHLPPTSSREMQMAHSSSGRIHTPHTSPASPSSLQTLRMTHTETSSRIQTPQLSPTEGSSKMLTPDLSPTSSSRIQIPQMPSTTPSTSLQTPQMIPTSFSGYLPTKPKLSKEASTECGYQRGPKEVVVIKATEPFTYELRDGERKMFHATVATENEFFQVKVFDITLKDKFNKGNTIAISDYIGKEGFLEINSASSVSDVTAVRRMSISTRLIQIANTTPKINHLLLQSTEKYVNGIYKVYKKTVSNECTFYEIQDNTGKMEVMVFGRLTFIDCEEGDRLKLFCFKLDCSGDKSRLISVIHSYIKVIKAKKIKT